MPGPSWLLAAITAVVLFLAFLGAWRAACRLARWLRVRWWLARLRLRGPVTRKDGDPLEGRERLAFAVIALARRKTAAEPSYEHARRLP
jgi:hypothetical protein